MKSTKAESQGMIQALELFRKIDPTIQANAIQLFLIIADRNDAEGIPQQDLEKLTGQAQASVSRNVAMFTDWTRLRTQGPGYLESFEDPLNRRQKRVRLTPKGARFLASVHNALA